jgi:predicted enzyme related to lactoylglutathione lyase
MVLQSENRVRKKQKSSTGAGFGAFSPRNPRQLLGLPAAYRPQGSRPIIGNDPTPSEGIAMLLGLRTVIYHVKNLDAAKTWYTQLTGAPPYFDQPFYVGFNVGGYELGLLPDEDDEAIAYWGTPDIAAEIARVLAFGATVARPPQDVGDGILVAVIVDPEGNRVGLIENPHFKLPAG